MASRDEPVMNEIPGRASLTTLPMRLFHSSRRAAVVMRVQGRITCSARAKIKCSFLRLEFDIRNKCSIKSTRADLKHAACGRETSAAKAPGAATSSKLPCAEHGNHRHEPFPPPLP